MTRYPNHDASVRSRISCASGANNSASFWATVCKTVRPTLSDQLSVLSVYVCPFLPVSWWLNSRTDQDETWHAGKPRPWPYIVRWGPSCRSPKWRAEPPPRSIFDPYLVRPNGCRDQDATSYGGRTRPRQLCVRWGPTPLPIRGRVPLKILTHVYCG